MKSRGGGELAEIIFLNKPYLVNVTTKGEGIKILKNLTIWFMDDPKTNLWCAVKYVNFFKQIFFMKIKFVRAKMCTNSLWYLSKKTAFSKKPDAKTQTRKIWIDNHEWFVEQSPYYRKIGCFLKNIVFLIILSCT